MSFILRIHNRCFSTKKEEEEEEFVIGDFELQLMYKILQKSWNNLTKRVIKIFVR